MRGWWSLPLLVWGVLAVGACAPPPTPQPPPPGPTPNIQATVEARIREHLAAPARPTPTPAGAGEAQRALLEETARAVRSLMEEWEAFRADFARWRQGLTACTPEAHRRDLRGFAVRFYSEVSAPVNALAPPPQARRAAELLSEAVAKEEKALRRLAEKWGPGSPQAFLEYETERAAVDVLRRQARQALEEARRPPTPTPTPSPEATPTPSPTPSPPAPLAPDKEVEAFLRAWEAVQEAWEAFRARYDAWRARDGECDREAVRLALQGWREKFQGIVSRTRALPTAPAAFPVTDLLREAAEQEASALTTLQETWAPYDPAPFTRFDTRQQEVDRLRRSALRALDALLAGR
jgi:DNA-directed RNA polymerase specialized sigma24 family protein